MVRRERMLIVLFTLLLQSCSLLGSSSGSPTVSILSPASGATVPVNIPVAVQTSASDPDGPGVLRIDLQVNGVTVDSFEAASAQANVSAELLLTPSAEGAISVSVIAFRGDGTASIAATIALQVVGLTQEPASESASSEEQPAAEGASDEQPAAEAPPAQDLAPDISHLTFARANVLVNIRERPGPGCLIIGQVDPGDVIEFLERTDVPVNFWYKVPLNTRQASSGAPDSSNYVPPVGGEQYGWVFQGDVGNNFTLVTDDNTPKVHELGCLFCGDGVCSAEIGEACDQCNADCGACPFCGDGAVNQPSEACDGGGCGTGEFCNANCQCELEPAVCGDGIINGAEACDGDDSICGPGFYCTSACICFTVLPVIGVCGNEVCEAFAGEDATSCPIDCS